MDSPKEIWSWLQVLEGLSSWRRPVSAVRRIDVHREVFTEEEDHEEDDEDGH